MKAHIQFIFALPLLLAGMLLLSCTTGDQPSLSSNTLNASFVPTAGKLSLKEVRSEFTMSSGIRVIFEDRKGHLWFGTERQGLCRYDGHEFTYFTKIDGAHDHPVLSIQEDQVGTLWVRTSAGLHRFDGRSFSEVPLRDSSSGCGKWALLKNDLWFRAGSASSEVYHVEGPHVTPLAIPRPATEVPSSQEAFNPYWVYSIHKDQNETLWLGTMAGGVVRYDGESFSYILTEGFNFMISSLYTDREGRLWFGSDGGGVYRYANETLVHISAEYGLCNDQILKTGTISNRPGTLARVFAIEEDAQGNMWFATIDSGVWKYDGTSMTNYTIKDGLPGNDIMTITRDRKGLLWFGASNGGVSTFDGSTFEIINSNDLITDGC